jgi:hypothetical protein
MISQPVVSAILPGGAKSACWPPVPRWPDLVVEPLFEERIAARERPE